MHDQEQNSEAMCSPAGECDFVSVEALTCPPTAHAESLDIVSLVFAGMKPEPSWAPGGQAEAKH